MFQKSKRSCALDESRLSIGRFIMGLGWHMFSENALLLYQQDLQLGPYFAK